MTGRGGAGPTWRRLERATGRLSSAAVRRMEELPWFQALPARQRAEVGLVVQAGLAAFVGWLRDAQAATPSGIQVFTAAPPELARHVTLKQTVQLIRIMVEVVEEQVPSLADAGEEPVLEGLVLRYSREVAFAAAEVYAAAAEARGAWDARVEAGVVEALVRGQVGELTASRAASLGWTRTDWVLPVAAAGAADAAAAAVRLRAAGRAHGLSVLVGEAAGALLLVVGGAGTPEGATGALLPVLPEGPVVVGPAVPDLLSSPPAVREALAGLDAVAAWPAAPRPVDAGALLAERAVLGDAAARARLREQVWAPLAAADLVTTAAAYLDCGTSVEATGRALFVHPNTVRYRLRKVADTVGLDLTAPRDAQAVRVALVLGRCGDPTTY